MPPVDNTPYINMGNFELIYSLQAYNRIPVSEYISKKTGLTVVIAEVEGPVVNGYFCLATEAFDDDGLPHTLEHLIFLGSEEYPYKGVLDLLANRCLASGTNAWTDIDHTCYTMETAGSDGFLSLMPIFLEHILYPVLTDEAFITEVYHVTGDGTDAGVVYCEMQSRENSAESRMHLTMSRNIYPGKCGYSSETGGIMKNLRESTSNKKVRDYHKEFYRPENLKIIITGQVKHEEVFKALENLERKIASTGSKPPFQRPWQGPVPPIIESSKDLVIKYPADEESNGLFVMAWRGPSSVKDLYSVTATMLLLKYLTEFSVSPLPKELTEIDDPYGSRVSNSIIENSESCMCITLEDVPVEKLPEVGPKLREVLSKIRENKDIDMERLRSIINRFILENLSSLETSPHQTIAFMIIGHMLYGHTKSDLEQRINPLTDAEKLIKEPLEFWLDIMQKYLIENKYIAIQCIPRKEEQILMAQAEKERIESRLLELGEEGLKTKEEILTKAVEFNERDPPADMLTSVPIPSLDSIRFHPIRRREIYPKGASVGSPVFAFFDDLKTSFAYIFAIMDTSRVPVHLRSYIPLLLESILELPLERDGKIIPYETVVAQLNDETVSTSTSLGIGNGSMFCCGEYSTTATIALQVDVKNFKKGLTWLKELLYNTVLDPERLKVLALKMNNTVAQTKRRGRSVVNYVMKGIRYSKDTNIIKNGMLVQNKFLTNFIQEVGKSTGSETLQNLETVRKIITDPKRTVLYIAANSEKLTDPKGMIYDVFMPKAQESAGDYAGLHVVPDHKLLKEEDSIKGCIVGMGCLESSFFVQTVKSINSHMDDDLPPLMLYLQYLIQAEGPMWKQIRGKGYAYNYTMALKVNEGLLYLGFGEASNVVAAYKETRDILTKQLQDKQWDKTLLDSAKSSIIFEIINEEKTIGSVVSLSLMMYIQGLDYTYNRELLKQINNVTMEDLNRVGEKYIAPLFDVSKVRTAVVTDPAKIGEISAGLKKLALELDLYTSLENSFLDNL